MPNTFPKLHNATWPGVVGKGSPDGEPSIDLDTMIDLTAKAEVKGVKFDNGVTRRIVRAEICLGFNDACELHLTCRLADRQQHAEQFTCDE